MTNVPETARSVSARRHRPGPVVVGAFLLVALGLAAGLLVPVVRAPNDASPEAGFARDMATHHAQAVEMSMIVHGRTADREVGPLAMDIALTQQAQIGIMRTWLSGWRLSPTGERPAMAWMGEHGAAHHGTPRAGAPMPGMATPEELDQLRESTGVDLDIRFTELMIRHHLGGIAMVDAVLAADPVPEVRDLAASMRAGQQNEINTLRLLRERLRADGVRAVGTDR
ncbi:DUF305 domain-containing protein [Micromonospora sp. NPDC049900]|uniref:DUF305 domain-containing protein n=1 Tax=unclassified Micromonospora TaxID=2617518 RepID=UPI0037A4892E